MAFPASPSNGATHTAGGVTYVYDSTPGVWKAQTFDTVSAGEALTKIKTVDGSGSGLDADTLDGITSGSFLRSNADDTATGKIVLSSTISAGSSAKLQVGGFVRTGPVMIAVGTTGNTSFNATNEAWITNNAGDLSINSTGGSHGDKIWHAGNDGSGSGLDADLIHGVTAKAIEGNRVNYASSAGWGTSPVVSFSSQSSVTGGAFNVNGSAGESRLEYATTPSGGRGIVWGALNNDADSGADGGWNKTVSGVDSNKSYMSVVFVRRNSSNQSGSFYHGCGGAQTLNMNGTTNTNPYFKSFAISDLPEGVWCVSIGYIQANGDTNVLNQTAAGCYRLDTGALVSGSYSSYRMKSGVTEQIHRTYLYYSTSSAAHLQWYRPGFYELDGTEPTLGELIGATTSGGGAGAFSISVFTSSGTWTKPAGCNRIRVQAVGGGGGAAGYSESGGGGGFVEEIINNPASSVAVTIGGGGASVQYHALAGDGGTTSFGSYCSASGGRGSGRNHQHTGGRGGVGSGGHINFNGGGGTGHTNSNASGSPAKGGSTYFGGGAGDRRDATNAKNGNGSPGTGGPGSRGDTGWRGAPGEAGCVVVYSYE